MMKQARKFIAIMLTFVFVLSLLPLGAMAEVEDNSVTGKIAFTNYAYSRPGSTNGNTTYKYGTKTSYHYIITGGSYNAYAQLDFSGYEEIISNPNTKAAFRMMTGGTVSGHKTSDFDAYIMPGTTDGYSWETITGNIAASMGLHNTDGRAVLFSKSDGTTVSIGTEVPGNANLSGVVGEINADPDDGIITLYFKSDTAYLRPWDQAEVSGLYITYDPDEIDNQDYVETIAEELTWDVLSSDEASAVVNNLTLPSKWRGANVTWVSSNPEVVGNDGAIVSNEKTTQVTLTATLSYEGIVETAAAGSTTKDFTFTVFSETDIPEEKVTTALIPFINYCYSRNNGANNGLTANEYNYSPGSGNVPYFYAEGTTYVGYAQVDLSDYAEILNAPSTTATINIVTGNGYGSSAVTYGFSISTVTDNADLYINEVKKMSRVKARDLGIHGDLLGRPATGRPVFYEWASETGNQNGALEPGEANIDALVSTFNESATNGLVTFLFNAEDRAVIRFNSTAGIKLSYYESELDSESYFDSIESSFTWANITNDAQEALVNNLPTYFKGASIAWSSTNGTVNADGTLVPVAGEFTKDTLTATVSYKGETFTKEFPVTVCDGELVLGTPTLSVEGGTATASISVTNGTGEDVKYILYLAIYNDNEMTELVPVTFNVAKGSEGTKTLTANGSKAKFFVWEADGITPAIKNAEN